MNKTVIYPGTFDPITYGHLDIIERAAYVFDKVIVSIINKPSKSNFLFSVEERLNMVKQAVECFDNVEIDIFEGLLVEYAQNKNVNLVVRGLRAITDFEYEFQMALTNKKIAHNVETIFMMTNEKFSYLSSSVVKEIAGYGGNISEFVPDFIVEKLKQKLSATYKSPS